MLKTLLCAFALSLATYVLGPIGPSLAHEGHDHGDEAPMEALPVAPRGISHSEEFEIVVAAGTGRLIIYLDNYDTNEPVAGAKVELIEGDVTVAASETAAGVYTINGWERPTGIYNLMIAVDTSTTSDLLPVTLDIPEPAPEPSTGYPILWVIIGQTATITAMILVLIAVYLRATRRYDYVLDTGVRLSNTALLLSTEVPQALESVRTRRLGPALVTERLWTQIGCGDAIRDAGGDDLPDVPLERTIYATVLQRMFDNEPNRPLRDWLDDHVVAGTANVADHHLDRAVEWLGREIEPAKADGAPGRTVKEIIEEKLFHGRVDAEAGLDLVFFNALPVPVGMRPSARKSKKRTPHPPAMAVGVVLDAAGNPVCFELWPGDPVDLDGLLPAIDRLRTRFEIRRVCLVSDLGVSKPATIDAFNERGIQFILGLRDSDPDLRHRLLNESTVLRSGPGEQMQIAIKEVAPAEAWTPVRERVIVYSETQPAGPAPTTVEHDAEAADEPAATASERAARRAPEQYVLRTNTDLAPAEVVKRYQQLLLVEETFRAAKAILDMQTLPSVNDAVVRGQMFCSFLALLLRREIEERLASAGFALEWRDVVRDLNRLTETEMRQAGRQFLVRSEPTGNGVAIADALGVVLPPMIERRTDAAETSDTETLLLPARVRAAAVRAGSAAVAQAELRIRAVGSWLERQA